MMNKREYNLIVALAILVVIWFLIMIITSPLIVQAKTPEPEVVEIVTVYDEAGNRGTATISRTKLTFSIEVELPGRDVVKVDNWRTVSYDMNDVKAVSDDIHCIGEYFPPKYAKYKITRRIFN